MKNKRDDVIMIKVIDDICGAGKTTYIIKQMQEELQKDDDTRFIYVTPYLDEVKRVKREMNNFALLPKSCKFVEPEFDIKSDFKKTQAFLDLIFENKNICTTHALFRLINEDIIALLNQRNYILIIDEVLDVVKECPITRSDCEIILDKLATLDKDNKVIWTDKNYKGEYDEYKRYAMNDNLYLYSYEKKPVAFFWNFPQQIFSLFNETYILTYMFESQIMAYYLKYHGIKYQKYSLDSKTHTLTKYTPRRIDKNLFDIIGDKDNRKDNRTRDKERKYNNIGNGKTDLCKSWFAKKTGSIKNVKLLNNVLRAVRKNYFKCDTDDLIWTAYKNKINDIKFEGFKSTFLSCSARATNQYQNRHFIMYGVNLFLNPMLKKYFNQRGIEADEDNWALSMLIQFVFRSAIRKGEKVRMYIPSKRMRDLFLDYIA